VLIHYLLDLFIYLAFSYRSHSLNTHYLNRKYLRIYPSQDHSSLRSSKTKEKKDVSLLFKDVPGSDLKVGDIVQLTHGQVAPCDILLLNTSELHKNRYSCTVDTWFAAGTVRNEQKFALDTVRPFSKLFSSINTTLQGMSRLTANIEYYPFSQNDDFKGTFKLKSDPKVETLKNENLIRKGSTIHVAHVVGLVLYSGTSSLYYKNASINMKIKNSTALRFIFWYTLTSAVLNQIFSISGTMVMMIQSNDDTFLSTIDINVFDGTRFFSYIVLFSPMLPLFVLSMFNLANAAQVIILEWRYKNYTMESDHFFLRMMKGTTSLNSGREGKADSPLLPKKSDENVNFAQVEPDLLKVCKPVQIMNPTVVPSLGNIDSVFFDKTGTLTLTNFDVQSIATRKKMYFSMNNNFKIFGMTNIRGSQIHEDDHQETELSFEGYNSFIWNSKNKQVDDKGEVKVYDFFARKVLPNPFQDNEREDTNFGDNLMILGPIEDRDSPVLNSADNQGNSKPLKPQKDIAGLGNRTDKDYEIEHVFDEVEFMADTKTDMELKRILQLFTICHNAKKSSNEE
jgi:magnesium-transporting ATPase (P-type)